MWPLEFIGRSESKVGGRRKQGAEHPLTVFEYIHIYNIDSFVYISPKNS
jgi:hypothetical protein